jgi:hypothetical protein
VSTTDFEKFKPDRRVHIQTGNNHVAIAHRMIPENKMLDSRPTDLKTTAAWLNKAKS